MATDGDLLAQIRVASPCSASWEEMRGDDRVRYCSHCRLNVYNLSAMSRRDAEALVREREGRLCVRFYQRRDGTLLTDDCPIGFRAVRRWLLLHVGSIAGAFGLFGLFSAPLVNLRDSRLGQWEPAQNLCAWIESVLPGAFPGSMALGRQAVMGGPPAFQREDRLPFSSASGARHNPALSRSSSRRHRRRSGRHRRKSGNRPEPIRRAASRPGSQPGPRPPWRA